MMPINRWFFLYSIFGILYVQSIPIEVPEPSKEFIEFYPSNTLDGYEHRENWSNGQEVDAINPYQINGGASKASNGQNFYTKSFYQEGKEDPILPVDESSNFDQTDDKIPVAAADDQVPTVVAGTDSTESTEGSNGEELFARSFDPVDYRVPTFVADTDSVDSSEEWNGDVSYDSSEKWNGDVSLETGWSGSAGDSLEYYR